MNIIAGKSLQRRIAKSLCLIKFMYIFLIYLIAVLCPILGFSQSISLKNLSHDLESLKTILYTQSSYFQISDIDLDMKIANIQSKFSVGDSVQILYLHHEISKIVSLLGDRHSRVYLPENMSVQKSYSKKYLPFIVAPFNNKIVALTELDSFNHFEYLSKNFAFLKKINGIDVDSLIKYYPHRALKAPELSRLIRGSWYLENISRHLFLEHNIIDDSLTITLTNGVSDSIFTTSYTGHPNYWVDIGSANPQTSKLSQKVWNEAEYRGLDKWLTDSIAYFRITDMLNYRDHPYFEAYLLNAIKKFESASALIFDLRGNGGGTRHILNTIAPFIIPKEHSPWVANIAYIRNDQGLDEDIESMNDRFLYSYYSNRFSKDDQRAIDSFMSTFKPDIYFPSAKFSKPFFMLLKSGETQIECPIYILVNEESFSAASVFTTSLKGLSNVKIVGVKTDGSSGRSRIFKLPESGIEVRLSTMLSFQRNGKTLDGNGTEPDILIKRKEEQILGYEDSQLEELIDIIKDKN